MRVVINVSSSAVVTEILSKIIDEWWLWGVFGKCFVDGLQMEKDDLAGFYCLF